jgi:hypothetical protein
LDEVNINKSTLTASATSAAGSASAAAGSASTATTQASNASNSATAASNSAAQATAAAIGAEQIVLGVASNYPDISPSLSLDFANTKALDPRITFARASTARLYDGKTVAKAEENLLLRSQEFDNAAWIKNNITVTANSTTAPDGTSTAETLVPNTVSNANHLLSQLFFAGANLAYTVSVYVKPAGYTKFAVRESQVTGAYATFNLTSTGAVIESSGAGGVSVSNVSIASVGDGWYRASVAFTSTSSTTLSAGFFALNDTYTSGNPYSASAATGDGTSGVFLWGAQVEQRSAVTAYTPTTTQPITNYIPALQTAAAGVARFEHNPITGESLGLLIEEQRTNLFTYSDDFDNASWTKANVTVTANTVVAPDGTLTGDKLVEATGTASRSVLQNWTSVSGTTYTFSVYAKKGERQWLYINGSSGAFGSTTRAWFDLQNGVVGTLENSPIATITDVGNGWYRCTMSKAATASATHTSTGFYMSNADGVTSYTGNGYSGIYIWGAQLEAGAFPTSYIPTTTAQVTRSADAASMTGANFSSWYRADQGSIYIDWASSGVTSSTFPRIFVITDGATSNILEFNINGTTGNNFGVRVAGTYLAVLNSGAVVNGTGYKSAVSYKVNDAASSRNGDSAITGSPTSLPIVNRLNIGAGGDGTSGFLNGAIKKLSFYPIRATNAQLQALTQN